MDEAFYFLSTYLGLLLSSSMLPLKNTWFYLPIYLIYLYLTFGRRFGRVFF